MYVDPTFDPTFFRKIKKISTGMPEKSNNSVLRVVPEAGLEPARSCPRGILSPLRLPIPPLRHINGGTTRNRTVDEGFADPSLTAWLWCHNSFP